MRIQNLKNLYSYLPLLLAAACLVVIVIYTWLYFFKIPYLGLSIDIPEARITELYTMPAGPTSLQPGDIIQKIGEMDWQTQAAQPNLPTFPPMEVGQIVPFEVLRAGQTATVDWQIPGFNWSEFADRFVANWYLAFIFWAFGLYAWVLLSPRDLRVGLMSTLFLVMSLWIIFGTVSSSRLFFSGTLLRFTSWILLAVSLHFHWIFPRPIAPLDRRVFSLLYLVCCGFALAELFLLLPTSTFFYTLALMALLSFGMLLVNFLLNPDLRRQASLPLLVFPFILMILIPFTLLGYVSGIDWLGELGIIALVAMPTTYIYALYSRRVGGIQFRTNRAISQVVFLTLVFLSAATLITVTYVLTENAGLLVVANIITTALAAWAGVSLYAPFQEWFDHRFLGMPVPPVHLLPWYSARLAESLDIERIADLLRSQVFPDLLVRQAALVRLLGDPNQPQTCRVVPLLQLQVSDRQLPLQANLPGLLEAAGTVSSPDLSQTNHELSWVRLVLSLAVDGKPIGLCLLGRRDPDDQFAPNEIQLIQALMDQTALALVHIDLASRLRSLVQADIQRQEAERRDLARELHDDLLGKMAVLAQESDWLEQESSIVSTERALLAYQEAVQEIRRLISNLRSAVLAYGLQLALEDLAEELQDNSLNRPQPAQVLLELSGDHSRYPEQVELHLFRIVQQACTNSLQHANPQTVLIQGDFQPGSIQLKICDDGSGFQTQHTLDLAQLLVNNQFGIVGMFERAMLIRAELTIDSVPGQGTQVNVSWRETAAGEESRNGKSHENNRTD